MVAESSSANEIQIKWALRRALWKLHGRSVGIVEEFWVPPTRERADIVVLRDPLHAFEIKSGRDNLTRLNRQVSAYNRVFDRCTLVVARHHKRRAIHMIPSWWGLTVLAADTGNGEIGLDSIRLAQPNPRIDPATLVGLLWTEEARRALGLLGLSPAKGVSRREMWEQLVVEVDLGELRRIVLSALRDRNPATARIPTRRFAVTPAVAPVVQ
jgi:hypothetical protein